MVSTQVSSVQAARWLLGRAVGGPASVWILLGVALFWGLQAALSGLGIASSSRRSGDLNYEVAFVSVLAAAALGLTVLTRHPWPWLAVDRLERASAELLFLLLLAASTLTVAWIPALVRSEALPWVKAAVTLAHVVALAQLVSRLPTAVGLRPLLLIALVWWIPAVLSGGEGIGQVAAFLAAPGEGPMQVPRPADMAPALAFCLSAWLLTTKTPRP